MCFGYTCFRNLTNIKHKVKVHSAACSSMRMSCSAAQHISYGDNELREIKISCIFGILQARFHCFQSGSVFG